MTQLPNLQNVLRRAAPVIRFRYAVLTLAALAFSLQHMRGTGEDWYYIITGSELLFGHHTPITPLPGGVHLYANYPQLQIGPLTFLLATPFRLLPGEGRVPAALMMTLVAPFLVFLLERTARSLRTQEQEVRWAGITALLGGVLVVQAWSPLATIYGHLDDVLVLSAGVVAMWAVARRRPWLVGLAIGLGIAAKPWGVVFLPLVLAQPSPGRWKSMAAAVTVGGAAWAPFVLGDPGTLAAVRPAVITSPASVLHLFGVPSGRDAPTWVRPVQMGAALLAGTAAVARHRWGAVLLVGVAVRIGLDPQVFLYYSAGLALGALAWDLTRSARALPVCTLAVVVLLNDAYVIIKDPTTLAVLRLVVTAVLLAAVLLVPGRDGEPDTGVERPILD